ncbi:MAG: hypothetical protein LBD30_06650, partial [Verrucomicrobiales bacterium]|nr:hypothetical protein [Verrucomicrobiales bacterium]
HSPSPVKFVSSKKVSRKAAKPQSFLLKFLATWCLCTKLFPMKPIPSTVLDQAADALRAGQHINDIIRQFQLKRTSAFKLKRQLGLSKPARRFTHEEKKRAAALFNEGVTAADIAQQLGSTAKAILDLRRTLKLTKPTPRLTDKTKERIAAALRNGKTTAAVAQQFGRSVQTIHDLRRTLNLPAPRRKRPPAKLTAERAAAILDAIRNKQTATAITRKFNTSSETLKKLRRQHGVYALRHHLTPAERDQVVAALRDGQRTRDISERHNISASVVQQLKRELGLIIPYSPHATEQQVITAIKEGLTVKKIIRWLNVSAPVIAEVRRRHGLPAKAVR